MSAMTVLQLIVSGITVGAIYALLGLGFVTIFRSSGVVNFAQGEFTMLGGLLTFYLLKTVSLPYLGAVIVAILVTALIGIAMYQIVIAPLGRAPLLSMVMVTVGASLFIQNTALLVWGPDAVRLPGISGDAPIRLGDVAILPQSPWVLLIAAVILAVLYLLNNHTLMGKAMTATATDPLAASLVGVSTGGMVRLSFAISAGVGALAGIALAPIVPINFIFGALLGMKGLSALILGGWGKATGAVIGGIALGLIETFGASVLPAGYKDAIAFLILIAILYFRPSGILGSPEEGEFRMR